MSWKVAVSELVAKSIGVGDVFQTRSCNEEVEVLDMVVVVTESIIDVVSDVVQSELDCVELSSDLLAEVLRSSVAGILALVDDDVTKSVVEKPRMSGASTNLVVELVYDYGAVTL